MKYSIFWHRRDLRINDNSGLYHALKKGEPIQPIFIFDKNILNKLSHKDDARVSFIHQELKRLKSEYESHGCDLKVYYGCPENIWLELSKDSDLKNVFTNRDYETYAKERDSKVGNILTRQGVSFFTYKDHVIFEKDEVTKNDGNPYVVFTPYKKRWLAKLESRIENKGKYSYFFKSYPSEKYCSNLKPSDKSTIITLEEMGFLKSSLTAPQKNVRQGIIKNYDKQRNFPSVRGTSLLGVHFRFGTISIREKARKAIVLNDTYLNELIWRDFYSMILQNFPKVEEHSFREKYEAIEWRNNEVEFDAWCQGKTGYPIVDAGMRELNSTGYMHNRVRMIVASFLTKHLLIDWRWGERYFAEKLLDFDLASNSGGWQWAAGCGTDAAPYFRVFNPYTQADKFDKDKKYIKKWVPEFGTDKYVNAIVDHKMARERCLQTYKKALNNE